MTDKFTTVVHTVFSKDIKFDVTKHKEDDTKSLHVLLKELKDEIDSYNKVNFPEAIIKIDSDLIDDQNLIVLESEIIADLKKKLL
jgi:hypothetical protein